MTKRILNGRPVAVIEREEYSDTQMFPIYETQRNKYYCDPQGNLYVKDRGGLLRNLTITINDSSRHRVPSIVLTYRGKKKRLQIPWLIAKAMFPQFNVTAERVGHLDGDVNNNAIDNIYYDLTIHKVDETIYR